jgi:DNA-binding beta-propeller fold protein YncE
MSSPPRTIALRGACVAVFLIVGGPLGAQINEEVNIRPEPYRLEQDHFKLPEGRSIGSTVTLALDPDGTSIWVFERCGGHNCVGSDLAPILKFDASGNLVKSFGAGLFNRPHGIHVDYAGNVWVTDDEGPDGVDPRRDGKGHQVLKFSPEGKLLMWLGKAGVAGDGLDEFNRPSAVLIAPNGDIFVGDGHGGDSNARVVKFSADGRFITSWGRKGTAPGEFETPHTLALDSRGRLFVGDRGNNRIQLFDQSGNLLEEWDQFSRPSGVHIDHNDVIYVADSMSDDMGDTLRPEWQEGIRIGSAADGRVTAFIDDGDLDGSQEGVVADVNGVIYASLTGGMALRRYVKR